MSLHVWQLPLSGYMYTAVVVPHEVQRQSWDCTIDIGPYNYVQFSRIKNNSCVASGVFSNPLQPAMARPFPSNDPSWGSYRPVPLSNHCIKRFDQRIRY